MTWTAELTVDVDPEGEVVDLVAREPHHVVLTQRQRCRQAQEEVVHQRRGLAAGQVGDAEQDREIRDTEVTAAPSSWYWSATSSGHLVSALPINWSCGGAPCSITRPSSTRIWSTSGATSPAQLTKWREPSFAEAVAASHVAS